MDYSEKIKDLYITNIKHLKIMKYDYEYFRILMSMSWLHNLKMRMFNDYRENYKIIDRTVRLVSEELYKQYNEVIEYFDKIKGLKEEFETEIIEYLRNYYKMLMVNETNLQIDFVVYRNLGRYMKNIVKTTHS